jgi:hypothetical protein
MLCVTSWNAVLELKSHPYVLVTDHGNPPFWEEAVYLEFNDHIQVADPDCIDAGMLIPLDEIKLVARIKR